VLNGRFPGETSCLSLVWAVLYLFMAHARDATFTDVDRQHLYRIRYLADQTLPEDGQLTAGFIRGAGLSWSDAISVVMYVKPNCQAAREHLAAEGEIVEERTRRRARHGSPSSWATRTTEGRS